MTTTQDMIGDVLREIHEIRHAAQGGKHELALAEGAENAAFRLRELAKLLRKIGESESATAINEEAENFDGRKVAHERRADEAQSALHDAHRRYNDAVARMEGWKP